MARPHLGYSGHEHMGLIRATLGENCGQATAQDHSQYIQGSSQGDTWEKIVTEPLARTFCARTHGVSQDNNTWRKIDRINCFYRREIVK